MNVKKGYLFLLVLIMFLTGCQSESSNGSFSASSKDQLTQAKTTPYGKYPETIDYTLAKMIGSNQSNMPTGDTYTDNAYTRFLLKKLNIQNKNVIESSGEQYTNNIDMIISSKNLPDIMVVESYENLQYLVENDMIEDLSESYKNCATDRIKEMYQSYGSSIMNSVTFDGKIYAVPETNIEDGPNLFWVRQDWLDKLGLDAPQTFDDVEKIVSAFINKDPGNNGKGKTIGLMVDTSLTGESGYSSEYLLDILFACHDTYPKQWVTINNEITYGSIDNKVKDALAHIQRLYKKGIIDKSFLLRSNKNIINSIISGQCGSFFGPWWSPNNPLVDAIKEDSSAVWKPYLIATDKQGNTSYHSQNPTSKYIVVRKGYEHPEIAFKIISVIFDYLRYDDKTVSEINEYFRLNVDPTARPLPINVDYKDALHKSYVNILKVINNEGNAKDVLTVEESYAAACQDYLSQKEENKEENWAAYASRIEASSLLENDKIKPVESLYFGTTETMSKCWWRLRILENETFLKIITGEEDIGYFDEFVEEWLSSGGKTIIKEVQKEVKVNKKNK